MNRLLCACLVVAATLPGQAASWRASERLYLGNGRALAQDLDAGVRSTRGCWDLSARMKSFRIADAFQGTMTEYSGRLSRQLEHVTVAGRLGSAPPNAQRAAYHLAGGEALLTFYGRTLGPEDPSALGVSEDTATTAGWAALPKAWVTRLRAVYTTTNHHKESPVPKGASFRLVQHSWQLALSETISERTTLTVRNGHDRYGAVLKRQDPQWYLWNVDNAGAPLPLRGWPNNHVGVDLERRLGDWTLRAGFNRINMEFDGLYILVGGEALWRPRAGGLTARAGWYQAHARGGETRSVGSLGASYAW